MTFSVTTPVDKLKTLSIQWNFTMRRHPPTTGIPMFLPGVGRRSVMEVFHRPWKNQADELMTTTWDGATFAFLGDFDVEGLGFTAAQKCRAMPLTSQMNSASRL